MIELVECLLAGTVLGFLIGLTGVGGGVLTVPILILVLRLEPITAVGTASLYSVLTKSYAVFRHYRLRTINWRAGSRFLVAALPGVICTSLLVRWAKSSLSPAGVDVLQDAIGYAIVVSMLLSLGALLLDYRRFHVAFFVSGPGKVLSALCAFFVGAIMGATSIGGGILIIPALLLFFRETENYVGTSLFVAVVLMFVVTGIYAFLGQNGYFSDVNLRVAGVMALGSLAGTHYGSSLSKRIDSRRLQYVVVGVILVALGMMVANLLR